MRPRMPQTRCRNRVMGRVPQANGPEIEPGMPRPRRLGAHRIDVEKFTRWQDASPGVSGTPRDAPRPAAPALDWPAASVYSEDRVRENCGGRPQWWGVRFEGRANDDAPWLESGAGSGIGGDRPGRDRAVDLRPGARDRGPQAP